MKRKEAVFLAGLEFLQDRLRNDGTVSRHNASNDMGTWGSDAKLWAEAFCEPFEFDEESDRSPGWAEGSGFTPTSADGSEERERRRVYSKIHQCSAPQESGDKGGSVGIVCLCEGCQHGRPYFSTCHKGLAHQVGLPGLPDCSEYKGKDEGEGASP